MIDNILVVGSMSGVLYDFMEKKRKEESNVLQIDRFNNKVLNDNYLKINFMNKESYSKIHSFLSNKNLSINKVVFSEGINPLNNFFSTSQNEWDTTININAKSVLFTLKSIYNFLSSHTSIVVIASTNGIVGHSNRIEYGPSKAALIQLVKNLTIDFSLNTDKDIRINAISPTYVKTKRNSEYLNSYKGKQLLDKIPYHKFINPEDISNAIEFLLSKKSNAIRGHNLILDNGYTIV